MPQQTSYSEADLLSAGATLCYIYTLHASNDPECRPRYVGFTTNPKARGLDHNWKKGKGRKYQWAASLRLVNEKVILNIVFTFRSDDLTERKLTEASWIECYRKKFPDLLNDGSAGQGISKTSKWLYAKMKARYSNPDYRAKLKESKKRAAADPQFRAKMREVTKLRLANPEYRARHKEALKRAYSSPEYKARRSALTKKQWERPENLAKFIATRAHRRLQRKLDEF